MFLRWTLSFHASFLFKFSLRIYYYLVSAKSHIPLYGNSGPSVFVKTPNGQALKHTAHVGYAHYIHHDASFLQKRTTRILRFSRRHLNQIHLGSSQCVSNLDITDTQEAHPTVLGVSQTENGAQMARLQLSHLVGNKELSVFCLASQIP